MAPLEFFMRVQGVSGANFFILKSVPKLYAVIVKFCQLMMEKKSFEEISLVYG